MLKIASMSMAGILLVFASGLVLKKNGVSHAALPMPKHNQAKIIAAMMLQEQGYLPSPGMIPKKASESKAPSILLEESKEPPLIQNEVVQNEVIQNKELTQVQFQPMKEDSTLPLFTPAPILIPALIPVLEETKKPVVEDKKETPAKLPLQIQDEDKAPAPTPSQTIDLPRVFEGILSGFKPANIKTEEPKNGSISFGFKGVKPPFIKFEVKSQIKTNTSEAPAALNTKQQNPKLYLVRFDSENFQEIAKTTLGNESRWHEIAKLNPTLNAEAPLEKGAVLNVPADATLQIENPASTVQPLPEARPKLPNAKSKILVTLTGTYPRALEGKRMLTLPPEVIDQLGNCTQVLMSPGPGPDPCLWLTSVEHLEKLSDRLEHSPASEMDVRVFRRLFFGQIEKIPVQEGKIVIPERLALFGSLEKNIAIVGVEDHFEIWDLERWRKYTQKMSPLDKK